MDIRNKEQSDLKMLHLFMNHLSESLKIYSIFKYIYDNKGDVTEINFWENEKEAISYLSSLSEEEQFHHMKESLIWMGTIGFDKAIVIIKFLNENPPTSHKKFILHGGENAF